MLACFRMAAVVLLESVKLSARTLRDGSYRDVMLHHKLQDPESNGTAGGPSTLGMALLQCPPFEETAVLEMREEKYQDTSAWFQYRQQGPGGQATRQILLWHVLAVAVFEADVFFPHEGAFLSRTHLGCWKLHKECHDEFARLHCREPLGGDWIPVFEMCGQWQQQHQPAFVEVLLTGITLPRPLGELVMSRQWPCVAVPRPCSNRSRVLKWPLFAGFRLQQPPHQVAHSGGRRWDSALCLGSVRLRGQGMNQLCKGIIYSCVRALRGTEKKT